MSGAMLLLPLGAFMAWTGKIFTILAGIFSATPSLIHLQCSQSDLHCARWLTLSVQQKTTTGSIKMRLCGTLEGHRNVATKKELL